MPHRFFAVVALLLLTLAVRADEVVFPPQPVPAGVPIDAFPAPRIDQLGQFLDHLHQARLMRQVDLIFDGDSITDFWQAGNRGGPLYQKLYAPRHAVDFGISGDRTEHVLWRLAHGQLDTLHPKLVMLMIGTNNMGPSTAPEIADGVTKIVQAYRTQVPDAHILLLGIFPRDPKPGDALRVKVKAVNDIICKLDDGAHITYLDIGDKLLNPDGTMDPAILPDGVHPSAKGYQIWADAVQPVIDKYCPPVPFDPAANYPPSENGQIPDWVQKNSTPEQLAKIDATFPTMTWPFPMHAPEGTSTASFPLPHSDWFFRFADDQTREKQGPYDFVMDGDSITDNWQGDDRGRPVWKQRYANIKVLDNAIGGDQVQHVLWRIQHGGMEGLDPKLIMLMIGTNDCGRDPKGIAQGIRMLLDEYEKRCPSAHILLLGVFPRDPAPDTFSRKWIAGINALISTYSSDPRVTYMDIGSKFLQPDGTLTAEIMPDFLHPSTKGYVIWADAIQPVIDKYFPNAAAPKSP
jgi:lysophospholipase L1-like esterase